MLRSESYGRAADRSELVLLAGGIQEGLELVDRLTVRLSESLLRSLLDELGPEFEFLRFPMGIRFGLARADVGLIKVLRIDEYSIRSFSSQWVRACSGRILIHLDWPGSLTSNSRERLSSSYFMYLLVSFPFALLLLLFLEH